MMSIASARPSDLRRSFADEIDISRRRRSSGRSLVRMLSKDNTNISDDKWKENLSSDGPSVRPEAPCFKTCTDSGALQFDKLQPSDEEFEPRHKRIFGCFIAREAILDEEYWMAAWLRAESHWEEQPWTRYVDSYKRKFAEQEFNALRRRCKTQHLEKCACIIAVKKPERNLERSVLNSVVGTVDIRMHTLLRGETFPGEHVRAVTFGKLYSTNQPMYGYVANLCVAKYARRHGIATNMLVLAIDAAKSYGVDQVFVHVHKSNKAARDVYEKLGFKIVEKATHLVLQEEKLLLSLKS